MDATIICSVASELGYVSLKPEQLDVVLQFVKGRDTFAVLPTGFGYSSLPSIYYNFQLLL